MTDKDKFKKPIYKKWWFIALIVLFSIAALGTIFESDESKQQRIAEELAEELAAEQAAEERAKEKELAKVEKAKKKEAEKKEKEVADKKKEEPKPTYKIGDTVNVGKMTYVINSIETTKQVGPELLKQKASGIYVILNVTLKNNGNNAVTVDSSFFKLKRGEKTYEADTVATMYASQNNNSSFFIEKVNPDSQLSGKVVFDVATEVADSAELQVQVQTGVWGTETEMIDLR